MITPIDGQKSPARTLSLDIFWPSSGDSEVIIRPSDWVHRDEDGAKISADNGLLGPVIE